MQLNTPGTLHCGKLRLNRDRLLQGHDEAVLRNERIRGQRVGEITKKVQERRLKWYGRVMRREEHYVGMRAMEMKVQWRRKRGRPKRRW